MQRKRTLKTRLTGFERALGLSGGALLAVLLILFQVIKIDGAVIASGQAVVTGNPREVQSLDGGIATEILVAEGDRVAAGDVLMQLDPSILQINRDIILGRLVELTARRGRLVAEARDLAAVVVPDALPGMNRIALLENVAGQREIFAARRAVQQSRRAQLQERILQYENEIVGMGARIVATQSQIDLLSKEVINQRDLADRGLITGGELLEKQSRLAALLGEVAVYRADLAGTRNGIRDAELKITQAEREFREAVSTELRDVSAQIEENRLELARIDNQLLRLVILAPVSGVVHEMQTVAAGGVIAAQATILKVVPVMDGVTFDLQVPPDAIDVVHIGQTARVRFPAFDSRTTPELFGTIAQISPDSIFDESRRRSYYRVKLEIPPEELARFDGAELLPGMPVEAFLQTGRRSILSYLVKPFADHIALAFREG